MSNGNIMYIVYIIIIIIFMIIQQENADDRVSTLTGGIFILLISFIVYCFVTYSLRTNLILFATIFLLLSILYLCYYFYSYYQAKNKINNRIIECGLIPLDYEYGRLVAPDVRRTLQNITLQELWKEIMCTNNPTESLLALGYNADGRDNNVLYDLLWYLTICKEPRRMGFNYDEAILIGKSSDKELLNYLGENYSGAVDRASLEFSVLTGYIVPKVEYDQERYNKVKNYSPLVVYNLTFTQGNIIDTVNRTYATAGPYTYLSTLPISTLENIIINIKEEDHDELIEKLGIGPIHNINTMNKQEILIYLQGEISLYNNVFLREFGTQLPPSINSLQNEEIRHVLSFYTNMELIQAYEPRRKWNSRADLLNIIENDITGAPKWSIYSVSYCINEDSINIITAELHKDMDKNDKEDPTLSFGKHKNYRCYQASELEASFDNYNGVFLFSVPDWTATSIDNITGAPMIKEFTLDSIKQLRELLILEQDNYNVKSLIAKINTGLEFMKTAAMQLRHLNHTYSTFSTEQKHIVEVYFCWMFTYSMWMRFWKGPGNPWPMTKININSSSQRNKYFRSSPEERDEHVFIQNGVRTSIIEMYEKDNILKEWIESLPAIYYDFDSQETSCATYNIKEILDKIALGDYCMGFGSDTILKTAYCYIVFTLEHKVGPELDNFISKMLPIICDLEYSYLVNHTNKNNGKVKEKVMNNRLSALSEPIPAQPGFDTHLYQNNVHTE